MTDPLDPRGLEAAHEATCTSGHSGECYEKADHDPRIRKIIEAYLAASRENASPSEHRCHDFRLAYLSPGETKYRATCACGEKFYGSARPHIASGNPNAQEDAINAFLEHVLAASPRRENAREINPHDYLTGAGIHDLSNDGLEALRAAREQNASVHALVALIEKWRARCDEYHERKPDADPFFKCIREECADELERALAEQPA